MLIELLFVPGCPNHEAARNRLKHVLEAQSLEVPVREVPVQDEAMARSLRFPGSPTIRVDNQDVEPEGARGPALACRLYSNGTGVPCEDFIRRAISAAQGVSS
jgi:hypothetical protein